MNTWKICFQVVTIASVLSVVPECLAGQTAMVMPFSISCNCDPQSSLDEGTWRLFVLEDVACMV